MKFSNLFSKLKDTLSEPLPKVLKLEYKDCFTSAVIFLIAGIIILFTFKIKLFALFPLIVCILFFIAGVNRKSQLINNGYYELTGTLIDIDQFFSTIDADGLIVDIQGRSVLIPKVGKLSTPAVGTQLTVFIPSQEQPYKVNGIDCFTRILGYSVNGRY